MVSASLHSGPKSGAARLKYRHLEGLITSGLWAQDPMEARTPGGRRAFRSRVPWLWWLIELSSDSKFSYFYYFIKAGSLIIALIKVIGFYSWLITFSQCFYFSAFWNVWLWHFYYFGSSFEVWIWKVHFQMLLWICFYYFSNSLIWIIVHLPNSIWLSDWSCI